MFKGYWHIVAIGIAICLLTKWNHHYFLFILFVLWLIYLYKFQRIQLNLIVLTIFTSLFFFYYVPSPEKLASQLSEIDMEASDFFGKIKGPIVHTDKTIQFTFQDVRFDRKLNVIYFKDNESVEKQAIDSLKYGANCHLNGTLETPEKARNPHQFDFQMFLLKKGISHQLIVPSLANLNCNHSSPLQIIYDVRNKLLKVTSAKLHENTVAWLHALVLGEDVTLDDEIIQLFQRWSLSHILAISGLHVGIVVGIIYFLLVRLSILTKEKAQWIMILFLPIYAVLAGSVPSVWRASMMVLFIIIINKIKWKFSYTDIVSIIFIILIFFDKLIIYHIGFQLSFAVTFGLIMSRKWLMSTNSKMIQLLQISFISQMIILPLQIHYFSIFQPLSIILNMIVVPYYSLFVIPSMFLLLICIFFLPNVVIRMFESVFLKLNEIIFFLIRFFDEHVNYPFVVGTFSIYFTIIYYIIFICLMIALEKGNKRKALQFALSICLFLIVLKLRPYVSSEGTVTMLDIGQGDAFVIELPYRKGVFLVDAGATATFDGEAISEKVYKQIIKPYLFGRGIQKIDTIFVSHEHVDHFGSVEFIVDDIEVGEIVISSYYELEKEWETKWTVNNTPIKRVNFDEQFITNGHYFHVLSPNQNNFDANENSLVLYTNLGGLSWVFTGDIGKKTEKEILKNFADFSVDVLKIGHHGSNTSTDPSFIFTTKPKFALIPVGVNNRYGHPEEEVITTLEVEDVVVFRTDIHGAVQYHFRNGTGSFTKYLNE